MCGIAGIFSYRLDGAGVDREELVRIRDSMRVRGPDQCGLWISPERRIGLGHRRLSIIDLSEDANQPLAISNGRYRIVFNGEIYNYRELREQLEEAGDVFSSESDTEVLLRMYARHGRAMLNRLRGMFAFAIWDETEKTLFMARDPFGIKPLYFSDDGKTLRFASQVKALLHSQRIDRTPNPAGIVGFFLFGSVPDPHTCYSAIQAVPAGSTLSLKLGNTARQASFCSLSDELARFGQQPRTMSQADARKTLERALCDTVRAHRVADVPVGIFLSAGIDSTCLLAASSSNESTPLEAVTLGFEELAGSTADEVPLARLVANFYGAPHQAHTITSEDFQAELPRILEVMDQPSIDGINTYFISRAAASAGLKVMFSGVGGDELFGGYPSFVQVPQMTRLLGPFGRLPALATGFRRLTTPVFRQFTSPKYAGLLEYGPSWPGAYLLRAGLFMPWELEDIIDGDLARTGLQQLDILEQLDQTVKEIPGALPRTSALELAWFMRNRLLRDADWASMAHSVELRAPFVDMELLRMIGPIQASGSPLAKSDLASCHSREAARMLENRPKTGFAIPVERWTADRLPDGPRHRWRGLRGWSYLVMQQAGFL